MLPPVSDRKDHCGFDRIKSEMFPESDILIKQANACSL
jgi:hypothetical protein